MTAHTPPNSLEFLVTVKPISQFKNKFQMICLTIRRLFFITSVENIDQKKIHMYQKSRNSKVKAPKSIKNV